MVARFTEAEMMKLAEIYKDYDCLWNVKSCFYKNRDSRDNAYKEIWKRLNVPGLSIKDVPIKIKNLRTSYHQELKKIDISLRSGASPDSAYKPKVSWFFTVDGYLSTFKSNRITYGNTDAQSIASDYISDNEQNEADEMFVEEKYNPNETPKLLDNSYCVPAELIENDRPEQLTAYTNTRNAEINEAIERIDKIAEQMTRNINRDPRTGEDEFDSFGKYIASALRGLPAEAAIMAKTELQKTLSHIQLRALRQS